MSLVLRLAHENIFADPRQMSHACQNLHVLLTFDRGIVPCACHAKQHLNVQKCSVPVTFLHFSLRNVLRATTARTFSTCQLPKVVRDRQFLTLLTWKCASPTVACNFSSPIWPDGSAPATLASLLFDPPKRQIIGKTQCFATLLPCRAPGSSFFSLFLFSDLLPSSLLLSDSSHLCFPICPFSRKFDF